MAKSLTVNKDYLYLGITLSFVLHIVSLIYIKSAPLPTSYPEINVTLVNLKDLEKQFKDSTQIVSAPDTNNNLIPKETRFESDKNTAVEKEAIKRGDSGGIPAPPAETKPAQRQIEKPEAKKVAQPAPTKKRVAPPKELKLRDNDLLAKYSATKTAPAEDKNSITTPATREFSRAPGTGAAFYGTQGVPDYLPELPDGDLTLLNTKASLFAVFVRRVATRVFGEMRQAGWDYLFANDINKISNMATVEAVINLKGDLVSVTLLDGSGSSRFDEVLVAAVKKGSTDKNPPPAAVATDGNIHFIFKSRSWVRPVITRSGTPSQQRWLLLGTGLQ